MRQVEGATIAWGRGDKAQVYPLLRTLFAQWDIPEKAEIGYTAQGKPYLPNYPHRHISVSHSGEHLFCGVGCQPLGVDIECIRPRRVGLFKRVLSQKEYRWLEQRGGQWEDFYSLWVMKEGLLKCCGTGINRPLTGVCVPLLEVGEQTVWQGHQYHLFGTNQWRACLCMEQLG